MDQLFGQNILIFDTPTTAPCNLRASLVAEGATVHVVSTAKSALLLLERKRIHAAFVACFPAIESHGLCNRLRDLRIPQILTGSHSQADRSRGPTRKPQFALSS